VRGRPALAVALIALAVVTLDQIAKGLVRATLTLPGTSVAVVDDLVRLTYTRNSGAAFGILPGSGPLFIGVSVIVIVSVLVYAWRWRPVRIWVIVALGLVGGGAAGNLVDRALIGWVTDFIQVPFDFPVFNFADASVCVGVGMLVWWLLFGPPSKAVPVTDTVSDAGEGAA
jgi:signal peptidase II